MIEQEQDKKEAGKHRFNPITLIIMAVFALTAIAGTSAFMVRAERADNSVTSEVVNNERVVIVIEGMHCSGCASGIKAMLKRTPGIVSAEVSYENKQANVEYNPADISREKILEVITNLGYKASIKG